MSVIEQFLGLVKDTLAEDDEIVYEYILNQFAWVVQNIGEKSSVAPVLIGIHGIGKTMFTNAIFELFASYSVPNKSNMEQLTGQHNQMIEDKIFDDLNELINVGYGSNKRSNSEKLKDISQFKIRKIPKMEAKKNIIKVDRSAIDEFIIKCYDQLVAGVEWSIVKGWILSTYLEKYYN
ncbi:MAG: hypothetical protein EZS28_038151 [Streblomastix strix]|uniref:Uncharacterized protein n=1 Tax=Streblomastix strix TaxID=222440 RepID=A0A5J4U8T2_9EUKA|nr:MAG: hypothetical protein EZS28_038151 [Streblomastix strix]